MSDTAAHEATTGEEVQAWHDQAYEAYEKALDTYTKKKNDQNKAAYQEARDNLVAGVQYWRQVGEQTGDRTGIKVEEG